MKLRIGNQTDFVHFAFPDRLYRNNTEAPYEWNRIEFEVTSGAWKGVPISSNLTTQEILTFVNKLPDLIRNLDGVAKLSSIEDWIELELEIDKRGQIKIVGTAKDSDLGNKLEFEIRTDQSYFPDLASNVEKYLSEQVSG